MDEISNGSNARNDVNGARDEVDRYLTDRLLHDVGLPDPEARLYRLLRHMADADAATLAWRLDLPPVAVEKHLRRLVRRGYAARHDSEPAHYRAVDPTLAVHLAAARREHALLAQLARVGRASAAVPALAHAAAADRRLRHQPDPPVTAVDPADLAHVRNEVATTASTLLRLTVATPDAASPLAATATQRCTVFRRGLLDDDRIYRHAATAELRGDTVRLLPDPAVDLLAADDRLAVVGHGNAAYLLHPSPLLDLALRCFELAWDRALPLGAAPTAESAWRVSDDDHMLLALLAAGMKDQAIARRLGIGLRTVVRRIGNLARSLDAETRFQAGYQAARRGLLP